MNHSAFMPFNEAAFALTLGLLLLAPLAIAGVALINTGLGRARSAAQSLLGSLGMISVAVIVFALVGATFADGTAGVGHIFHFSGKPWNWCGTGAWFLTGLAELPARAQLASSLSVPCRLLRRSHSLGLGSGSLASDRRSCCRRDPGRICVSPPRPLDLGRWLAVAARDKLLTRCRLPR